MQVSVREARLHESAERGGVRTWGGGERSRGEGRVKGGGDWG